MVTGALLKNKRKRKNGSYPLGKKVKILSGDEITFEKINSLFNSGCLVELKAKEEMIVDKINFERRSVKVAYYHSIGKNYICRGECIFHNNNPKTKYTLDIDSHIIDTSWGKEYNKLNKKLQMIN